MIVETIMFGYFIFQSKHCRGCRSSTNWTAGPVDGILVSKAIQAQNVLHFHAPEYSKQHTQKLIHLWIENGFRKKPFRKIHEKLVTNVIIVFCKHYKIVAVYDKPNFLYHVIIDVARCTQILIT